MRTHSKAELRKKAKIEAWPPNYVEEFAWRQQQLLKMRQQPILLYGAMEYYRTHPIEWINDWCITYDPRAKRGALSKLPFKLFRRQRQYIRFLLALIDAQEGGLVEKSRDAGVTFLSCAFSVWLWIFWDGAAVGWGSRKADLVDKIGDPDSIFEKIRMILRNLPREFLPRGFDYDTHATYMKLVNPETGATITGEAGNNIGRGGRKLIYFKDESAHYERPELIEAALGDNTNVQVDISSVNGIGNVFHTRRENGVEWNGGTAVVGKTNVFVFDWRDDPRKDLAWYNRRKQKAIDDGLLHLFYQEVDRNYAASVVGIIIPPEWVDAAIDAHVRLGFAGTGGWCAGLDVADGGRDTNAYAGRKGVVLRRLEQWGERDTALTARRTIGYAQETGRSIDINYDCIGVGSGVKAESNRLRDEKVLPDNIRFIAWNAAESPLHPLEHVEPGDPNTPLNEDYYGNLKAQGWWLLRRRFEKTFRMLTEGHVYPHDELISLSSDLKHLATLRKELSQPTMGKSGSLKQIVNKTPDGTKSPNLGDAVMMCYHPVPAEGYDLIAAIGGRN